MRINNNLMAMNTHRQLGMAQSNGAKSMGKLSSGLRINGAADDAAGLAISEKMRGQIRGLNQASSNAQDGISMIQTAEGALNESQAILQRMRELAVQASNDTATTDDRKEMQKEVNQLMDEIDRISTDTEFNTQKLLDGSFTNKKIHNGANDGQAMVVGISQINSTTLGTESTEALTLTTTGLDFSGAANPVDVAIGDTTINLNTAFNDIDELAAHLNSAFANTEGVTVKGSGNNLIFEGNSSFSVTPTDTGTSGGSAQLGGTSTTNADSSGDTTGALLSTLKDDTLDGSTGLQSQPNADAAIKAFDNAIKSVSAERSKLGAYQNRLEHSIKNLDTSSENLQAAESRIRDVDMAKEMMELTKNNILQQAAQAMLAQANSAPQGVLQLLR